MTISLSSFEKKTPANLHYFICRFNPSGGSRRGLGGGEVEGSFETKLFLFHEDFSENQEKLINNQVKIKINKSKPLINLNTLSRNPGSAPGPIFSPEFLARKNPFMIIILLIFLLIWH